MRYEVLFWSRVLLAMCICSFATLDGFAKPPKEPETKVKIEGRYCPAVEAELGPFKGTIEGCYITSWDKTEDRVVLRVCGAVQPKLKALGVGVKLPLKNSAYLCFTVESRAKDFLGPTHREEREKLVRERFEREVLAPTREFFQQLDPAVKTALGVTDENIHAWEEIDFSKGGVIDVSGTEAGKRLQAAFESLPPLKPEPSS